MKLQTKLAAAALPFAHYLGLARAESGADESEEDREKREGEEAKRAEWSKKAESDDDRKQREGESDGEYVKRMEELDDDEDKKARGEHEDSDGDEGLDDDDEEAKAVRQSERARCAKIIAHGIQLGAVHQAAVFAFDTSMTSKQAKAALSAGRMDGGGRNSNLAGRMSKEPVAKVGPGNPLNTKATGHESAAKMTADAILRAGAKARGEKIDE